MIPKTIHYIWLGGNPMPKIVIKCMDSWKKYCPDYKIKRWDESNLNIDILPYCRQAYDAKKWAFASDVLRLEILKNEGGIYLDVDVELLKSLDSLLENTCFVGFERNNSINPGLIMGAEPHSKDVKEILELYDDERFVLEDGSLNLKTICERTVEYYRRKGLECNNQLQKISETTIYPTEYFNPIDLNTQKLHKTKNTYSIHHFAASWYLPKQKFKRAVKTVLNKLTFGLFGKIFIRK